MSQRSQSFLKRFKTERADKKGLMPTMHTPANPKQGSKSQSSIPEVIVLPEQSTPCCIKHPKKKAQFQHSSKVDEMLCYECAINYVKNNERVVKITPYSIYLRQLCTKEMEKLKQYEQFMIELVHNKFEQLRGEYIRLYNKAKQEESQTIKIPIFKCNCRSEEEIRDKFGDIIGDIRDKLVKFTDKPITPLKFDQSPFSRKKITSQRNNQNINKSNIALIRPFQTCSKRTENNEFHKIKH